MIAADRLADVDRVTGAVCGVAGDLRWGVPFTKMGQHPQRHLGTTPDQQFVKALDDEKTYLSTSPRGVSHIYLL